MRGLFSDQRTAAGYPSHKTEENAVRGSILQGDVMMLKNLFKRFGKDECGAVTVDFVVLTAGVIFMVLSVFQVLRETLYTDAAAAIASGVETATEFGNP
jgi:Flp pilus assembly pilin Flp